jgi:dissimilatory sulfite reductase (desulfoviridin) alpha/beta subunit
MKCDYKNSLQACKGDAIAIFMVTVKDTDDKPFLCTECTKYVTADARRCGYEWEVLAL